jgi:hypothetical protein
MYKALYLDPRDFSTICVQEFGTEKEVARFLRLKALTIEGIPVGIYFPKEGGRGEFVFQINSYVTSEQIYTALGMRDVPILQGKIAN